MPELSISRKQATEGRLPKLCVECGARATKVQKKSFSCNPPNAVLGVTALLVYVALFGFMNKQMTICMPFCEKHQNHWKWRARFTWVGLFLVCFLGLAALLLFASKADNPQGGSSFLSGFACMAFSCVGLVWLAGTFLFNYSSIRPTEISEDTVTLAHVCQPFIDAVWKQPEPRGGGSRSKKRKNGRRSQDDGYELPE